MDQKAVRTELLFMNDLPESVLRVLEHGREPFFSDGGMIFLPMDGSVLCCEDNPSGRMLVESILRFRKPSDDVPQNASDLYFRIITGSCGVSPESICSSFGILNEKKRCVTVFQASLPPEKSLCSLLSAMAPVRPEDTPVDVDFLHAALISPQDGEMWDEAAEYAEAVICTLEGEGITGIKAGIGREAADLKGLRDSYLEACSALRMGAKYHGTDQVYQYSRQTLERIIECIPDDRKRLIREEYFSRQSSGGLSDEMMETVREFFKNDLNLTATAKQLFIHRNTLNYRLDKIRKEYNLDLRRFQDAVAFRIITAIPEER